MKKRNLIILILSILIVIVIVNNIRCRTKIRNAQSKVERSNYLTELKNEKYIEFKTNSDKQIKDLKESASMIQSVLRSYDQQYGRIKRLGINDPVEFVKNDLMENHDLIPNRETPKGPMYFQKSHIYVLNDKWVIAYYEDGHFDGYLLASYEIDNNKEVTWKVLDRK